MDTYKLTGGSNDGAVLHIDGEPDSVSVVKQVSPQEISKRSQSGAALELETYRRHVLDDGGVVYCRDGLDPSPSTVS